MATDIGKNKKPLHPIVNLAKKTVESYVNEGKIPEPSEMTPEMKEQAGVFVSIKKFGELRGCIGTFMPTKDNVAEEIVFNAISSATRDPRFDPVSTAELPDLTYSVDILTKPELVEDIRQLNPKKYGVIVECGGRKGLLLPDLEGVDTVEMQINICCQKGGIVSGEPVKIYRFEVKRYGASE
jgi:AmmeMemoRadiSam system protein A